MIAFYKNLKNGASKSEALRQAQLTMLKSGDPPALWAAFVATVIQGNFNHVA